ncbi:hypothetical protein LWF15_24215 [Kineosporia rhizophila]|uniref:hypothetical protein n=1 Tax=Kineosporia TaxID=49184 RepID=UPI001E3EB1D9|nr:MULTISPECIES: hypothetical protein [Kineosporia]MCE0538609.1 hypothetical protein [Kineosporia rhizophila]GLY19600.1 hypothetical protein Kisp01_66140 [Kineosporia sp. NBRC 101677]
MDAHEAQQTLDQVAQRRQQAIDEGTAPWSWRATWSLCSSALALGVLVDVDMIWLWVLLMVMGVGFGYQRGVTLKGVRPSLRWQMAYGATLVLAVLVNILFQAVARGLDWPMPNTIGMIGVVLVFVGVTKPVQASMVRSMRP